ncbi:MAG: hypothetical protein QXY45_03980 [Candidatus Aenigmatarchaeota archaeon]
MKVAIFSKTKLDVDFDKLLGQYGLDLTEKKPDIVLSIGGDGTYLISERNWPGIPKLIIKYKSICNKCETSELDSSLKKISEGAYNIIENIKLETRIKRKRIICVNEFSIRNRYATTALRFFVWINDERTEEIIGDGVVVSTPFGSTGYYRSICRESFEKGIGVAFNNPTKPKKSIVSSEDSTIKVRVNRGDAVFTSDNDPKVFLLDKGETVVIKKSREVARIVDIW